MIADCVKMTMICYRICFDGILQAAHAGLGDGLVPGGTSFTGLAVCLFL